MTFTDPETNRKTFAIRLKVAIPGGCTYEAFAKKVPASVSGLKKWLSATAEPGLQNLIGLSEATGATVSWLASGEPINLRDHELDIEFFAYLRDEAKKANASEEEIARWEEAIKYAGIKRDLHSQQEKLMQEMSCSREKGELADVYDNIIQSTLNNDFVFVPRYDIKASAGAGSEIHSEQIVDYLAFKADWVRQTLRITPSSLLLIEAMGDSMEVTISDGDLLLINTAEPRIKDNAIYALSINGDLVVKRIQRKIDGTLIVKSDNPRYDTEVVPPHLSEQLRVIGQVIWHGGLVR